jgi:hypothetical protein
MILNRKSQYEERCGLKKKAKEEHLDEVIPKGSSAKQ